MRRQQSQSSPSTTPTRRRTSAGGSSSMANQRRRCRRNAAAATDAAATTQSANNMSLYQHPLLLIAVTLLIAFCPSPWVATTATTVEKIMIEDAPTTKGRSNNMLGGIFDNVKKALGKKKENTSTTTSSMASTTEETESAATSTTTIASTTATGEEGVERSEEAEEAKESSQVCIASENGNREDCIPEVVGEGKGGESGDWGGGGAAVVESLPQAVAETAESSAAVVAEELPPFTCQDIDQGCSTYTKGGTSTEACLLNSAYMTHHCPVSCNTCDIVEFGYRMITTKNLEGGLKVLPFCQDNDYNCKAYADNGECTKNPGYMNVVCEASCGICAEESNEFGVGQRLNPDSPEENEVTKRWLQNVVKYMHTIQRDDRYANVFDDCVNLVPNCVFWAANVSTHLFLPCTTR